MRRLLVLLLVLTPLAAPATPVGAQGFSCDAPIVGDLPDDQRAEITDLVEAAEQVGYDVHLLYVDDQAHAVAGDLIRACPALQPAADDDTASVAPDAVVMVFARNGDAVVRVGPRAAIASGDGPSLTSAVGDLVRAGDLVGAVAHVIGNPPDIRPEVVGDIPSAPPLVIDDATTCDQPVLGGDAYGDGEAALVQAVEDLAALGIQMRVRHLRRGPAVGLHDWVSTMRQSGTCPQWFDGESVAPWHLLVVTGPATGGIGDVRSFHGVRAPSLYALRGPVALHDIMTTAEAGRWPAAAELIAAALTTTAAGQLERDTDPAERGGLGCVASVDDLWLLDDASTGPVHRALHEIETHGAQAYARVLRGTPDGLDRWFQSHVQDCEGWGTAGVPAPDLLVLAVDLSSGRVMTYHGADWVGLQSVQEAVAASVRGPVASGAVVDGLAAGLQVLQQAIEEGHHQQGPATGRPEDGQTAGGPTADDDRASRDRDLGADPARVPALLVMALGAGVAAAIAPREGRRRWTGLRGGVRTQAEEVRERLGAAQVRRDTLDPSPSPADPLTTALDQAALEAEGAVASLPATAGGRDRPPRLRPILRRSTEQLHRDLRAARRARGAVSVLESRLAAVSRLMIHTAADRRRAAHLAEEVGAAIRRVADTPLAPGPQVQVLEARHRRTVERVAEAGRALAAGEVTAGDATLQEAMAELTAMEEDAAALRAQLGMLAQRLLDLPEQVEVVRDRVPRALRALDGLLARWSPTVAAALTLPGEVARELLAEVDAASPHLDPADGIEGLDGATVARAVEVVDALAGWVAEVAELDARVANATAALPQLHIAARHALDSAAWITGASHGRVDPAHGVRLADAEAAWATVSHELAGGRPDPLGCAATLQEVARTAEEVRQAVSEARHLVV